MILKNHFVLPGIMLSLGRLICINFLFTVFLYLLSPATCLATGLFDSGLYVIPYPQKVVMDGDNFNFDNSLNIVLDKNHSPADEFAGKELIRDLKNEWNTDGVITNKMSSYSIVLGRQKNLSKLGKQGYQLSVNKNGIIISAFGEEGLF